MNVLIKKKKKINSVRAVQKQRRIEDYFYVLGYFTFN